MNIAQFSIPRPTQIRAFLLPLLSILTGMVFSFFGAFLKFECLKGVVLDRGATGRKHMAVAGNNTGAVLEF